MDGINALQLRDNARAELMQIKDIETGFEYLSKVKAIEVWAKAEKKDSELQNLIAEQKIRTQRILGQLIKDGQDAGEIAKQDTGGNVFKYATPEDIKPRTLSEIGLTAKESSTFKQIASIPDDVFESTIAEKKEAVTKAVSELTTAGMLKVAKEIKKEKKKEEKERIAESAKDLKIKIDFRLGDCESIFDDIPDGSIDCIITDPPYPFEFINTWSKLSKLAKRVLKHNGFCIAYSGQMYLPEVLKRMSEHLDYYWMFNLRHSGNYQLIMGRNIFVSWKPLLIFQNGFKKLESPIEDLVHGTGMSKDHHRWEQAIDELKYLIENFTEPGQSILDPFSGSGTTLIASYKLNRKPIGCELSEIEFNNAKRRIYDDLHI